MAADCARLTCVVAILGLCVIPFGVACGPLPRLPFQHHFSGAAHVLHLT